MSVSAKLAEALMLTRILKSRKLMVSDFPASKMFTQKSILVKCRRCEGTGTEKETAGNCQQCGGRGVEKLSQKVILKSQTKSEEKGNGE